MVFSDNPNNNAEVDFSILFKSRKETKNED
jgi:hypothetical protein